MVAGTRRGLLLTCLWYIREVDPATLLLTGLTRDGVYLVENGEVVAEVDHNFRFNHSPLDVVRQATEVGATERTLPREWKDWFTRVAMPPMRVPELNMSSVSPAADPRASRYKLARESLRTGARVATNWRASRTGARVANWRASRRNLSGT